LPVVTTSIGAEGMQGRSDDTLVVADDPRGYADAIVRLCRDDDRWSALSRGGREWIEENMSSRTVSRTLSAPVEAEAGNAGDEELTSIVILTYGQLEQTRACLESIEAHT